MTDYPSLRKSLHEHPQTAGNEQFAHDLIVRHLQQLHPAKVYTHVGGYGVIAVWEGRVGSGERVVDSIRDQVLSTTHYSLPTIVFRADTDALPIGHRCGHDGHTAILLRLAELIDGVFAEHSTLTTDHCTLTTGNNILLLFQPAEETGQGARAVLESGILQQYDIRAIYALHNIPGYPLGTVVLCPHTFAAASTGIVFRLDGRETHASTPELGINPGLAVAEIIQRVGSGECIVDSTRGQALPTTHYPLSTNTEAFATLICVRLGSPAFGTSAGSAELMFTLRAFTNAAMERLLADANAAVDEIASRHSLKVSRSLVEPFRATENDPACVDHIKSLIPHSSFLIKETPFRWSEDFGEYLQHFPGAMFGIGSGEHQPELHHPDYDFPDALIEPAARLFFSILTSHPAAI